MFQLLVEGYIHELSKQLSGQIVPSEVIRICVQYFYGNSQMLFFTDIAKANCSLYLTDVASTSTEAAQHAIRSPLHSVWKCNPSSKTTLNLAHRQCDIDPAKPSSLVLKCAGICTKKNILFPSQITQQMRHSTGVNAIFKCGGMHGDQTSAADNKKDVANTAYIISDQQFEHDNTLSVDVLHLPPFPLTQHHNSLVYSSKYGLFSVGGKENVAQVESKRVYNLRFDSVDFSSVHSHENEWKWKECTPLEMKRSCVSLCTVDNERRLFMAGGFREEGGVWVATRRALIYDIESAQWNEVKSARYARYNGGLFYDKSEKTVYIGGGCEGGYPLNKFEVYDMHKNKWFRLPATKHKHGCHAVLWKQDNQHTDILNVASYSSNAMETLDLRQSEQGWNVVYSPPQKEQEQQGVDDNVSLTQLFGIDYVSDMSIKYRWDKCRFLRFAD